MPSENEERFVAGPGRYKRVLFLNAGPCVYGPAGANLDIDTISAMAEQAGPDGDVMLLLCDAGSPDEPVTLSMSIEDAQKMIDVLLKTFAQNGCYTAWMMLEMQKLTVELSNRIVAYLKAVCGDKEQQ